VSLAEGEGYSLRSAGVVHLLQEPRGEAIVMAKRGFYGWKIVMVFWAIMILNFAFPTFGLSVVNTYMAKAMHLDRKELGLAYSAFSMMAGLPGPLVGLSITRFGLRLTTFVGALVTALGALLMALTVNTVPAAILVLGLISGPGAAMAGTIGAQVGTARWFHAKRGRAMSLMLTASGIGGFAAVPILNLVIMRSGGNWRSAWWCMAAMSLCAAVVAALFIRESPAQMGQLPDGGAALEAAAAVDAASAAATTGDPSDRSALFRARRRTGGVFKTSESWTLGEVLRSPVLWLLMFTNLGFFMGFFIYVAHGIAHLEGLGHSPGAAARSISMIMISSLIGQFTVAWLGDRVETRYIFAAAVLLFGVGMALSTKAIGPGAIYPYAICMGTGFSACFTSLATMLSNYFGSQVYPLVLGVTTPIGTVLGAIGPVLAGWSFDKYGSYAQAFHVVAGICFASTILLLFARPPVRGVRRAKATHAAQAV
jgi:MFS family permease